MDCKAADRTVAEQAISGPSPGCRAPNTDFQAGGFRGEPIRLDLLPILEKPRFAEWGEFAMQGKSPGAVESPKFRLVNCDVKASRAFGCFVKPRHNWVAKPAFAT